MDGWREDSEMNECTSLRYDGRISDIETQIFDGTLAPQRER